MHLKTGVESREVQCWSRRMELKVSFFCWTLTSESHNCLCLKLHTISFKVHYFDCWKWCTLNEIECHFDPLIWQTTMQGLSRLHSGQRRKYYVQMSDFSIKQLFLMNKFDSFWYLSNLSLSHTPSLFTFRIGWSWAHRTLICSIATTDGSPVLTGLSCLEESTSTLTPNP